MSRNVDLREVEREGVAYHLVGWLERLGVGEVCFGADASTGRAVVVSADDAAVLRFCQAADRIVSALAALG